jgi:hypothetical protein
MVTLFMDNGFFHGERLLYSRNLHIDYNDTIINIYGDDFTDGVISYLRKDVRSLRAEVV